MTSSPITAPYPSPEQRRARTTAAARACSGELVTIGTSHDGEAITAVRVPSRAGSSAPRVLCCAAIHGIEYVATLVALGLLDRIDGPAASLLERAELWVVPCLNPDGYRKTWQAGGDGTIAALRTNAAGVDLNRNFPLPAGEVRRDLPGAGSIEPGTATFIGVAPLSEPETCAIDRLCGEQRFHAAADLHSFMGTLIPARTIADDEYDGYRELCRAFAGGQLHTRYRRLANRVLDTWTGEQEDHLHHAHRCWSICVETFTLRATVRQHLRAPTRFWRFNPRDPQPWIDNDVPGLVAYFAAALARERPRGLAGEPAAGPVSPASCCGTDP